MVGLDASLPVSPGGSGPSSSTPLPTAALALPAVFLVEAILGGPTGVYGGVSVRLLLLAATCAVLLMALLIRRRITGSHLAPILAILGFLLLNGAWIAIVPVITGTSIYWSLREGHAFLVLLPTVLTLALLSPEQLGRLLPSLQRLVVVTSLVLATFQIGIWVLGTLAERLQWLVPLGLGYVYGGAREQLYVGPTPDGFFRVFWISSLWCMLSYFWIPSAFPALRARWLLQGILLMALVVTYSRGVWLGLAAGQLVAFGVRLAGGNYARVVLRATAVALVAGTLLAGALAATGTLGLGVKRLTSTTSRDDASISERIAQVPYLQKLWAEHPLLGNGYGAHSLRYVRSEQAPYSYEHMPYALLAKLGVVGLILSGLAFAGYGVTAWHGRREAPVQTASFLAGCSGLLIAEMTNPMVLNFVSMCIFACLLLQWAYLLPRSRPLVDRLRASPLFLRPQADLGSR